MADVMRQRGTLVDSLTQMLSSGEFNLDLMPKLILRIIDEEMWRQRAVPQKGWELSQEFASFEEFVTSAPLDGLNTSMQTIKDLCRRDQLAQDAIDEACRRQWGGDRSKVHNVNLAPTPRGNSQPYALRKLRKDRPDLHERVLSGELKPNAAMEQAGFRKLIRSVRMDDPDSAARTIRKFMAEEARRHLAAKLLE